MRVIEWMITALFFIWGIGAGVYITRWFHAQDEELRNLRGETKEEWKERLRKDMP